MMLNSTQDERVRENTLPDINRRIDEQIERNIRHYSGQTKEEIYRRVHELEQEWDIERVLETMASSFSLTGMVLGFTIDKRWFVLPTVVLSFLLLHAIQGWCPPVPVLRRLGIRTRGEIDRERYALKALAGDFAGISKEPSRVEQALAAVKQISKRTFYQASEDLSRRWGPASLPGASRTLSATLSIQNLHEQEQRTQEGCMYLVKELSDLKLKEFLDKELWCGGLGTSRSRLEDASRSKVSRSGKQASAPLANKHLTPFFHSQSGGVKLGISDDPCYKSWDVDTQNIIKSEALQLHQGVRFESYYHW